MSAKAAEQTGCPKCNSQEVLFRRAHGIWLCGACDHNWSAEVSDPDHSDEKTCQKPLRIFLSYGHEPPEHVEVALRIKRDLEERGHTVWFDVEKLKDGGKS